VPPPKPYPIHDSSVANDALHAGSLDPLHAMAHKTLAALVDVLSDTKKHAVENVTLDFESGIADVNAFATCAGYDRPIVIVTDGLLEILRQIALARATDEVFGTDRMQTYMRWSLSHHGQVPPVDHLYGDDRRASELAWSLFVDELAFVIGHELAHHYLGHVGCHSADVGNLALHIVPLLSQAAELAADASGVANTLEVGRDKEWTEDGAVVVMQFFRSQQTIEGVVLAFIQTHPLAEIRLPTITATADLWRATNGRLPL
jgi:Zn-dependent protease with chaperone function